MERRSFIKQCGLLSSACFGISIIAESCSTTYYVQAKAKNNRLQVSKSDFVRIKNGKTTYRKYIIVKFEGSDFPIAVYRFSETEYSALLLRCTHQGNELNVNGDLLTCTAHGSEFDYKGEVVQGPAEQKLKSFPVSIEEEKIYLHIDG